MGLTWKKLKHLVTCCFSLRSFSTNKDNNDSWLVCRICLSAIRLDTQDTVTTPCSHSFHFSCISSRFFRGNPLCPICRTRLCYSLILDHLPAVAVAAAASSDPATVTISCYPEFDAIPASASPCAFSVLIKTRAPSLPLSCYRDHAGYAPIDLVAVLDISSSMSGKPMCLLRRAADFIVRTLSQQDRLSIVTFDTVAECVLPMTHMSSCGRNTANFVILHNVDPKGRSGTNIFAGLNAGIAALSKRQSRNPVSALILLSDGGNNRWDPQGPPPQEALQTAAASAGVPIHTFGIGERHDAALLHAISNGSGGTFSFLRDEQSIPQAFAQCIAGLLTVMAQHLTLNITAASPGVVINSIESCNYPSRISDGQLAVIDVEDLYADEEKNFLIEISVPQGTQRLLHVSCLYKDPVTQKETKVKRETVVIRRPVLLSAEEGAVSLEVDRQRNRVMALASIKQAKEKAEGGDLDLARDVLEHCRKKVAASAAARGGDEVSGWLGWELKEAANKMGSKEEYDKSGRAYLLSGISSHSLQRAVVQEDLTSVLGTWTCTWGSSTGNTDHTVSVGYQTQTMIGMVEKSFG